MDSFPTMASGYLKFVEREGVFIAFDKAGSVAGVGRRAVPRGMTWLEAALAWSQDAGLSVAEPNQRFTMESPGPDAGLIYIYRSRDKQYVAPLLPPMERMLFNLDLFAEVYLDSSLVSQLRWKTYVAVHLPAGLHTLYFAPYADYNSAIDYQSASIPIEIQPGETYFIEIEMLAGKGFIGPEIQQHSAQEATPVLADLRETW